MIGGQVERKEGLPNFKKRGRARKDEQHVSKQKLHQISPARELKWDWDPGGPKYISCLHIFDLICLWIITQDPECIAYVQLQHHIYVPSNTLHHHMQYQLCVVV